MDVYTRSVRTSFPRENGAVSPSEISMESQGHRELLSRVAAKTTEDDYCGVVTFILTPRAACTGESAQLSSFSIVSNFSANWVWTSSCHSFDRDFASTSQFYRVHSRACTPCRLCGGRAGLSRWKKSRGDAHLLRAMGTRRLRSMRFLLFLMVLCGSQHSHSCGNWGGQNG